jgi:uncharacterized protein (DUF885 family)
MRAQAPPHLKARYDEAAAPAIAALRSFNQFLETDLMNRHADWRLGSSKYAQKFRYVIATDQPPDKVLEAAEQQMQSIRDEMYRIAVEINGGRPAPEA